MSTTIRHDLSKRNPYYIPAHRRYELEHFCMQYHEWKMELNRLDSRQCQARYTDMPKNRRNDISSTVEDAAIAREKLNSKISLVESTAREVSEEYAEKIIYVVTTENVSYETAKARKGITCDKNKFSKMRQEFFWRLDKYRD